MVLSEDSNVLIMALIAWLSWETAAEEIYSAPPKVIYRSVGSDVVLSWCIPKKVSGKDLFAVTFYLKLPTDQAVDERAIAKVSSTQVIENLPSDSLHKSLFSPSQIDVTVTNCSMIGVSAANYSLFITNLTIAQGRIFKIQANYKAKLIGKDNETKLVIEVPPYDIYVNCSVCAVKEGDSAVILCNASGTPNPEVKWLNKSNVVFAEGNGSAILSLENIMREHEMEYRCIAENHAGQIKKTVVIKAAFMDLECSVENRNMTPYLLIEKRNHPPGDCTPSCVNTTLSTKRSETYFFSANNSYFRRTCNVTSHVYEKYWNGSCPKNARIYEFNLTYFTFLSNGKPRVILFFEPYIEIEDASKFFNSTTGNIYHEEIKKALIGKAECSKSSAINPVTQTTFAVLTSLLMAYNIAYAGQL